MSTNTESGQIPDYPIDVSMEAFSSMAKILNALGNEDALAIFLYAKDGINSSKDAIRALGLTQKRFYTRLKDLIDNYLIDKVDGNYRHTALGEIMCDIGISMEKLLLNKDKLEVIHSIQKSGKISKDKSRQLAKALSIDLPFLDKSGNITMIESYESLVGEIFSLIEESEESILFASKYTDVRVVDAILKARERGVKMQFLAEKKGLKDSLSGLRMMLSPTTLKAFVVLSSEFTTILRQTPRLIYSFTVIDNKSTIIEIPHQAFDEGQQIKDMFHLAFSFKNEVVSKKMVNMFQDLWEKGQEFSIL